MKKGIIAIIVVVIVIVAIIIFGQSPADVTNGPRTATSTEPGAPVPVSETVKISSQLSGYENAELGFAVKYPTTWEKIEADLGVSFIMPIDTTQVSTVAKLQGDINVFSGKCSFPPVTTIKDRGTVQVGPETLNTISMTNTVQGRGYFSRMFSLQKGTTCYIFNFSSITLDPASKGLTGSNVTQAQNNNKAIVNSADVAFTDMVKSFEFVAAAQGIDETKAPVTR